MSIIASSNLSFYNYLPSRSCLEKMVGFGDSLALAKDVVGVTLEMSCMAAILYLCYQTVPGMDGGVTPL